jgi:hypothetical protein
MSDAIPTIEPMGIRPQFKRIKPYLKSYVRGFDDEQYQDKIANLQRYAREGRAFNTKLLIVGHLNLTFVRHILNLSAPIGLNNGLRFRGRLEKPTKTGNCGGNVR